MRVKTGISGLDSLMEGGFPKNSVNLISGAPGTGKSLLCTHYIYHGALNGEPGIYITFEQSVSDVIANAKKIGMDLKPLINKGLVKIVFMELTELERTMLDTSAFASVLKQEVSSMKAKRLVIDSFSSLINIFTLGQIGNKIESDVIEIADVKLIPLVIDEKPVVRTIVWNIVNSLKKIRCTTLMTSELSSDSKWLSRDTISEFLVDGIITLSRLRIGGEVFGSLEVVKMRKTNNKRGLFEYKISPKGITVSKERGASVPLK